MNTQINKSPHALVWIVGIALILFCTVGIAGIMGWIPSSMSRPVDGAALSAEKSQPTATGSAQARSHSVAPVHTASAKPAKQTPVVAKCTECGIIESTREVSTKGEGSGLGAVGGAVVGGLIGNQVGGGSGRQIATVVGAVGGVVAGNEIEKRVRSTTSHEVTVRLNDGSSRVIQEAGVSTWRTGDRVKIVDGVIRAA